MREQSARNAASQRASQTNRSNLPLAVLGLLVIVGAAGLLYYSSQGPYGEDLSSQLAVLTSAVGGPQPLARIVTGGAIDSRPYSVASRGLQARTLSPPTEARFAFYAGAREAVHMSLANICGQRGCSTISFGVVGLNPADVRVPSKVVLYARDNRGGVVGVRPATVGGMTVVTGVAGRFITSISTVNIASTALVFYVGIKPQACDDPSASPACGAPPSPPTPPGTVTLPTSGDVFARVGSDGMSQLDIDQGYHRSCKDQFGSNPPRVGTQRRKYAWAPLGEGVTLDNTQAVTAVLGQLAVAIQEKCKPLCEPYRKGGTATAPVCPTKVHPPQYRQMEYTTYSSTDYAGRTVKRTVYIKSETEAGKVGDGRLAGIALSSSTKPGDFWPFKFAEGKGVDAQEAAVTYLALVLNCFCIDP